ncbi:MAG: septation protein SepH [Blastococcus sp.]
MRTLRLVALSDDGKSVILAVDGADDGDRFELPIDDRLRAAARGDARRLTQIDVDLGTELPPRVIQARIRSGETPEQVAAASGTRVERIMRFAHPVLQGRARVAEQAQDARVRLSEGTPAAALARFMNERLRLLDTPVDGVTWDAHRTDDGAWLVTAAWRAGDNSGTTRWGFDLPSRTVTPHDAATLDFAEGTRLVRVVPDVPAGLTAHPSHRSRPVTALRVGGRAPETSVVIPGDVVDDETEDAVPTAVALDLDDDAAPDAPDALPVAERPAGVPVDQSLLDEVADHDTVVLGRTPDDSDSDDPRARIPAWEDIVFGVRRHR